jgi:hypothetical protein
VAGNPRRPGDVPPVHDGRRAVTAPVSGPPTEGVVSPDVASSSPYRREMHLEVGSIAIWKLRRGSLHDSSRKAAPRRRGRVEVVGFPGLSGASGVAAGGVQSTGLQVPAGDCLWQTAAFGPPIPRSSIS